MQPEIRALDREQAGNFTAIANTADADFMNRSAPASPPT